MKMMLAIATVGLVATGVDAAPYYVGENLKPQNNVTLNFQNTISKKNTTAGRTESGNIAAIEVRGAYNVNENVPVTFGLPFYFANDNAVGNSRNAIGNLNLGLGWVGTMQTADREMSWGYDIRLNSYLPTSRKDEAASVAFANPTTDFFRYVNRTYSIQPQAGLFVMSDQFSAKGNLGYTFSRVSRTGVTDKSRNSITGQVGTSWHAMPNMHLNVEYNAIALDSATRADGAGLSTSDTKYRHALAPSISGNYDAFMGSLFASIPLDKPTRDFHTVAFGLNAGYTF